MSLLALDAPTLHRRQKALFVVPADAIRAAAHDSNWTAVCAALRVNALSCIKSAEHGWIGASFSCCEILAVLHLHPACAGLAADNITLSKGHAAAMQCFPPPPSNDNNPSPRVYIKPAFPLRPPHPRSLRYACRHACALMPPAQLLSYKDGPSGGLEAHADIRMDTGSLGQARRC